MLGRRNFNNMFFVNIENRMIPQPHQVTLTQLPKAIPPVSNATRFGMNLQNKPGGCGSCGR